MPIFLGFYSLDLAHSLAWSLLASLAGLTTHCLNDIPLFNNSDQSDSLTEDDNLQLAPIFFKGYQHQCQKCSFVHFPCCLQIIFHYPFYLLRPPSTCPLCNDLTALKSIQRSMLLWSRSCSSAMKHK